MHNAFDPDRFREITDQIVNLVTAPEFLAQIEAVRTTSAEHRLTEAANRLTPEALRERGIEIPEYTRISSRYFEEDLADEIEFADTEAGKNILRLLNEERPGVLDGLQLYPDVLSQLNELDRRAVDPRRAGLCVCVGGGAGGFSACLGAGN